MKRFVLSICFMVVMLSLSVVGRDISPPVVQPQQQLDDASQVMFDAPVEVVVQIQAPRLDMLVVDLRPVLVVDHAIVFTQNIPTYCLAPVSVAYHPPDTQMAADYSTYTLARADEEISRDADIFAHIQFY